MRKSAVLLIGVLGIFMVLGVLLMQSLVIIQRIASVSEIAGDVYVMARAETDSRPITEDTHVLEGYTVRTGSEGGVTLNWADGSRVRLGPETSIRVRKCSLNTNTKDTTSLFDLDVGRIWVRVLATLGGKTKFEVHTPTATAGVRGTVFYVEVDESGRTEVAVYQGEVEVAGEAGRETVAPGQQATVVGAQPSVSQHSPDAIAWSDQTGIVGPRLDLDIGEEIVIPAGGAMVAISGVSEPDATVTINGSPVELDRRNRFEAQVPVDEASEGMIVVSASDWRGAQTVRAVALTEER